MKNNIYNKISIYDGYKYDSYTIHRCYGCGKEFKVHLGEYIYKIGIKKKYCTQYVKFCTYNCRSKWKKEHAKELEKESWY